MTGWFKKTHKYRPAIHLNLGARCVTGACFFISAWDAGIGTEN